MSQKECDVETTKLNTPPFKNMKKVKIHMEEINDFTSVLFPDGKMKIVTCSDDKTIRIFDLETEKCEKIITHNSDLYSVHFYKEEQVLMATDRNGELIICNIFSPEIKIIKKIKISRPGTKLWKLTQVSKYCFFCCVGYCFSPSKGYLYSIEFSKKNKFDVEIEEIKYPFEGIRRKRSELSCIYKLKSEKSTILFSGGSFRENTAIKKYNFGTKKHSVFTGEHEMAVLCLTSFFDQEKNEEIILSGSFDRRIIFWSLDGQKYKEIELAGNINCFLNDFERNNIFVGTGYKDFSIYSLNLVTKIVKKSIVDENIITHINSIRCINWINEKNQNMFVFCSKTDTYICGCLCIFEIEEVENKFEKKDLRERINFIRDEEFIRNDFFLENNKKMLFSIKILNKFRVKNIFKVLLDL